jgi:hypothetical protein
MPRKKAYIEWIKRYIRFHGKRHPSTMTTGHVQAFLSHLAVNRNVAAAIQNQAVGDSNPSGRAISKTRLNRPGFLILHPSENTGGGDYFRQKRISDT